MYNENGIYLVGIKNLLSDDSPSILPQLVSNRNRLHVDFKGNYTKQNNLDYYHDSMINIYIAYELEDRKVDNPHFTAQNCIFGAVQITPDAKDKSKY